MTHKPIKLPDSEVTEVEVARESPDEHKRVMYGEEFYAILYYAPETAQCVVVLPNGLLPVFARHVIDQALSALVTARETF